MGTRALAVRLLLQPNASLPSHAAPGPRPASPPASRPPECALLSSLAMHPQCVQLARAASAGPLALALPPWLRAYVHCARRGPAGALAAVLINLNAAEAVAVSLDRLPHVPSAAGAYGRRVDPNPTPNPNPNPNPHPNPTPNQVEHELWAWELNSTHALQSAGARLALDAQGGATDLGERAVPAGAGPVRVRPWSIRFVELPDARAPQCF